MRQGTSADRIRAALRDLMGDSMIGCIATVDRRVSEPGRVAVGAQLGVPIVGFSAAKLSAVAVPNPATRTSTAIGTPSVAEAAALLTAGAGPLVVPKRTVRSLTITAAETR
jgi:cobalt-precorrin 5A hydrolase